MRETMANGVYQVFDNDDEIMLTITALENNTYRAVNKFFDITAKIIPLDDYRTSMRCITYKQADKNGHYRKTKAMVDERLNWLNYQLEEHGFIRKANPIN